MSAESWPWKRKFSCHSCRNWNLWPFDPVSGALTTKLSLLPHVYMCTKMKEGIQWYIWWCTHTHTHTHTHTPCTHSVHRLPPGKNTHSVHRLSLGKTSKTQLVYYMLSSPLVILDGVMTYIIHPSNSILATIKADNTEIQERKTNKKQQ